MIKITENFDDVEKTYKKLYKLEHYDGVGKSLLKNEKNLTNYRITANFDGVGKNF